MGPGPPLGQFGQEKLVWEIPEFEAYFWGEFCSDLGVCGTAKTWVSCCSVVKNETLANPRIWRLLEVSCLQIWPQSGPGWCCFVAFGDQRATQHRCNTDATQTQHKRNTNATLAAPKQPQTDPKTHTHTLKYSIWCQFGPHPPPPPTHTTPLHPPHR